MHTYIHTYIYSCTNPNVHIHMQTHAYRYAHVCIYIYIYIHTHSCTHIRVKDNAEVEWMYQMYHTNNEHMLYSAFDAPLNVVKLVLWSMPKRIVKIIMSMVSIYTYIYIHTFDASECGQISALVHAKAHSQNHHVYGECIYICIHTYTHTFDASECSQTSALLVPCV